MPRTGFTDDDDNPLADILLATFLLDLSPTARVGDRGSVQLVALDGWAGPPALTPNLPLVSIPSNVSCQGAEGEAFLCGGPVEGNPFHLVEIPEPRIWLLLAPAALLLARRRP